MASPLARTMSVLEFLKERPQGATLTEIADLLFIPKSATHRILSELQELDYVQQIRDQGEYALTSKLITLGMSFLSKTGIQELTQPTLNKIAAESGEFVRLSVIDNNHIAWLGRAQGDRSGLRYDPEMGAEVPLYNTAAGHAWLLTLPDERIAQLIGAQGFGQPDTAPANAPKNLIDLLQRVEVARQQGYSMAIDTFMEGMSAMAVPIRRAGQPATGTLSIAGPSSRLTKERMVALAPILLKAADELAVYVEHSFLRTSHLNKHDHPVISMA